MRGFSRVRRLSGEQLPEFCGETGHSGQYFGGEYDVLESHTSHTRIVTRADSERRSAATVARRASRTRISAIGCRESKRIELRKRFTSAL